MTAQFTPYRLLAHTTVHFGFEIGNTTGGVPSPLTNLDLSLPAGMGLESTSLGLATCGTQTLHAAGPKGCPDAIMGYGRALAEIPVGSEIVREYAEITTVMTTPTEGHTAVLYDVIASGPASAELIFPGLVLGASEPFGTKINTEVPITETWPGGPDASVVKLFASIGPEHLTYYRPVGDKRVPFKPIGMQIPPKCPKGGFPFEATLSFLDGSQVNTSTAIPCPADHVRSYRHR